MSKRREKPEHRYLCNGCGKTFATKSAKQAHKRKGRCQGRDEPIPREVLEEIAEDFPDGAYFAFMQEHGYDY